MLVSIETNNTDLPPQQKRPHNLELVLFCLFLFPNKKPNISIKMIKNNDDHIR